MFLGCAHPCNAIGSNVCIIVAAHTQFVEKKMFPTDFLLMGISLNYFKCYLRVCSAFESQSIAWSNPSPFVADVLNILKNRQKFTRSSHGTDYFYFVEITWKVLFFNASNPSAWCTSATLIQPSMSCLLANTTKIASFSSSSWKTVFGLTSCMLHNNNKFIVSVTSPTHVIQGTDISVNLFPVTLLFVAYWDNLCRMSWVIRIF